MITNNNFFTDDIKDRSERLSAMQSRIEAVADEIGVQGDLLDWARNCHDDWEKILGKANFEKGKTGIAFGKYQTALEKCRKHYQKSKKLLKAIIAEYENADEIRRSYSINGQTPRTRDGLESAVDDMVRQHEKNVDEARPWLLPAHFIDELRALRKNISELHAEACAQREKASAAIAARNKRFREDSRRLRLVYEYVAAMWGVQSSKFIGIGMLPKSMVWTKKRPPAPRDFSFEADGRIFRWNEIEGTDSYEMHLRGAGHTGYWTSFYEGGDNFCPPPEGLSGIFDFRVRAIARGKEGYWSKSIEVELVV